MVHIETRPDNTTHFTGQAMTIGFHVIVAKVLDRKHTEATAEIVKNTFAEIDAIYNKWNPDSEVSKLNAAEANKDIPISPRLEGFFHNYVNEIVRLSNGRFDPTIEPLQQLWKDRLEKGATPSALEIADIVPAIGWDKVRFGKGLFRKSHSQTKIDLGGIAKGLCVDLLVERLNAIGNADVYVEWGGEIKTSGRHSTERPWTVFISRLGDTDPLQAVTLIALENRAIATSGDYLQNWSVRLPSSSDPFFTTIYFHVFDTETLKPLEASYTSIASASVASSSCAFADGLATAAMTFANLEDAKEWAEEIGEKYPDTAFWFMTREQLAQY